MGFSTLDDVVSKLPGEHFRLFNGTSLTVGSPGRFRELWYDRGTRQGSLSHVLSINQGGTYFVSSHLGALPFTNPNSVSNQSCCIGKFSVWGRIPGDTVLLYDRVWQARGFHTNTNVTQNVASIAFVRSFDALRAELWATCILPVGSLNTNLTVNWLDASDVARTLTMPNPFSSFSAYQNITAPLFGIPTNGLGIKRVTSISINSNIGAAGELAFTIRVPRAEAAVGLSENVQDFLRTGLVTVGSNECLELVYYSNTVNFDTVKADLHLIIK